VTQDAQRCAMCTNVHTHKTPGVCTPKKPPPVGNIMRCRLALGKPTREKTGPIQLLPDEPGDHKDHIRFGKVIPQQSSNMAVNRQEGTGLADGDYRPIIYGVKRRLINVTENNSEPLNTTDMSATDVFNHSTLGDSVSINMHIDLLGDRSDNAVTNAWATAMINDINNSDLCQQVMTEDEEAAFHNISMKHIVKLLELLSNRNTYVVDYNTTATTVMRCNTAAYMLGELRLGLRLGLSLRLRLRLGLGLG
jgi:hypothetical protein